MIVGADLRGTIFGLYDVSEQIGVSPWNWWADVPVAKKDGVWALGGKSNSTGSASGEAASFQKSPSVRYRGFFINDEQPALTNWIK